MAAALLTAVSVVLVTVPTLMAQTAEPVRYEVKAESVWGGVRVHVTDEGKRFALSVATDSPVDEWQLTGGKERKVLCRGMLGRATRFRVEREQALGPDLQLVVLVATETGPRPVAVRLSRERAVTGRAASLASELEYREAPDRPFHVVVRDLYGKAAENYLNKEYASAGMSLQKALELDPDNPQVLKLLERVEREEAGGRNAARVRKAERQWQAGEPEFALETLQAVIGSDPRFKPALELMERIGNSESMKRHKELARVLASAKGAESKGDRILSERLYRKAVDLDPENDEAVNGLRRTTSTPGKKKEEKSDKPAPAEELIGKADRAYNLGLDCYRKGDVDGARRFWEETLAYQPGHFQAQRDLERLAKREGRK